MSHARGRVPGADASARDAKDDTTCNCCACAKRLPKPFGSIRGGPAGARPLCYGCYCLGAGAPDYRGRVDRMVARGLTKLAAKECRAKPDPSLKWVLA